MQTIEQILEQRGSRYGSFEGTAILSQTLKNTIMQHYFNHHQPNPRPLDPVIVEAITMICHKLARIGNGDPVYIENWRDISGYSELVVSHLNNSENSVDAKVTYVKKVGDKWVDIPK